MRVLRAFQDDRSFVTLKSPVKVYYDVSYHCGLRCRFCYAFQSDSAAPKEPLVPALSVVERILEALRVAEVMDIVALGGDLFAYPFYLEFLRLAASMGFGVGIITNATLVTDRTVAAISPYVNSCSVSFRGPSEDVFDAATGVEGAFAASIRGLRLLADHDIPVGLLYDPLPENYEGLFETVRMLVEDHGIPLLALQLNRLVPQGRGYHFWDQVCLQPAHYHVLFEQMIRVRDRWGIPALAGDAFPFCRVAPRYWSLLERCEYGVLWGAVTPQGDLKKCSVGTPILGNLLEEPLTEIWQHSKPLRDYRSLQWVSDQCVSCPMLPECTGGCSVSALGASKDRPDSWKPKAVAAEMAEAYRAGRNKEAKAVELRTLLSSTSWGHDVRPSLRVIPRFRTDTVGILCVPCSSAVTIEQSELPWLVVSESEKRVMELCTGDRTQQEVARIVAREQGDQFTDEAVGDFLSGLKTHGYLATE